MSFLGHVAQQSLGGADAPGTAGPGSAGRLFKRIAKVTMWRDTIPDPSQPFNSQRLNSTNALEVTDLRIKFKVERSLTKTPNQCDVYIYNLNPDSRADLQTLPLSVQLDAGYDGNARTIFAGDMHFGMSEQKGTEWETLLQLGDGVRTYNYARVNRSFSGGATALDVAKNAAAAMGMTLPSNVLEDPAFNTQFATGTASRGPARDELSLIMVARGYHWSTQNGKLVCLRDQDATNTPDTAIPVNVETGMVGSPDFGTPPRSGKPPHVTVKMLLYPDISPGCIINLTSVSKSGLFRVEKVVHEGDTHGSEWLTSAEIKPY